MEIEEVRAFVRESNMKIANNAREEAPFLDAPVPFICECGNPGCRGIAHLLLSDFDATLNEPEQFLVGEAHGFVPAAVVTAATFGL